MATKEAILDIIKDMKKHLKDDDGFATFVMNGLNFQVMPENVNKKGTITSPPKLALVFNPIIDGKQTRKGKYFWDAKSFTAYVEAINEIKDRANLFLKCMEKVNPKSTIANTKSDHTYNV